MKTVIRALLGISILLSLAGCASMASGIGDTLVGAAVGNPSDVAKVSKVTTTVQKANEDFTPEQEYYIGRTVAATVLQMYKPWDTQKANDYLNTLGRSLSQASVLPETFKGYHFLIMDTDDINAFGAPSGFVLVSRGLLRCATTEDEVAAILAHEIGHVSLKHGMKAISSSRKTEALIEIAKFAGESSGNDVLSGLTSSFGGVIGDIVKTMVTSGYSRDLEKEADLEGIRILYQVGYDPRALVRVMKAMETKLKPGAKDFAKTHPDPEVRIAYLNDAIKAQTPAAPAAPAVTKARAARYQAAMGNIQTVARTVSPGLRKVFQGLLMGAIGAVVALALWLPGGLERFEAGTWDIRARLFAKPGTATSSVVTILLDQKSLEWGKKENGLSWPWPREVYGAISDFCARAGARTLVFDVLFTEPSVYGVSDDEAFAAAAQKNGRIVQAMNFGSEQATDSAWPAADARPPLLIAGLPDWIKEARPRRLSFPLAEFPIPLLFTSANTLANAYLSPDPVDRVFRRAPLFNMFDGRVVPSEALAAYVAGNPGAHQLSIRPGVLALDSLSVPIDNEGRAILHYRGPSTTHAAFTAAAIVQSDLQIQDGKEPGVPLAALKDKYVFLGFSAPGLFDLKPSPMKGDYPGVEIHATMLDNILSSDFMRPWPAAATVVLLLLLCIGAAMAASASRAGLTAIVYVIFIPIAPALGIAAYALGYWLQIIVLELGVVFSLVGASLASYATEGQQKRYIKSAFSQYLSPTVIEQLIAHPERLSLGGERRELTIFFSDVQGFTGISEALTPEDLTALLNEYLTAMVDIIQGEGGTIDKFEGDAIIAFWNAPLSQDDHAVRGVRAALRCQARLTEMRPSIKERIGKNMFMRVGMDTGAAVVGNMGSKTRFDYTMLGDQVNLSARLEGINKQFGTYIMVSGATVEKIAGAFPARELSRVAVVGRKEPVTVYEPMLPEEFAARKPTLETFGRGLNEFYAGRFGEAERIFQETASVDPPSAAYAKKCRQLGEGPVEPPGWNGVWVMTEK